MCDEYEIFEYLESEYREQKKKRRRLTRKNKNPFDMEEEDFIKEYRLSPDLVRDLCEDLKPIMETNPLRCNDLSIERKVLAAIYVYAHGSYQKHTAKAQCIAQQTVSAVLAEFNTLCNKILQKNNTPIQTPVMDCNDSVLDPQLWTLSNYGQPLMNSNNPVFYEKFGIPGVIGCIDGTHIAIVKPTNHVERYICRKNYPSLNVQLICNADMEIISVDVSNPGSNQDSFNWFKHPLKPHLESLSAKKALWLLGDSEYPQRKYMMTPILDAEVDTPEAYYNEKHTHTHKIIERTIGVLKARFRCLLVNKVLHYEPEVAGRIANACAILHNICNAANLPVPELTEEEAREEAFMQPAQDPYTGPLGGQNPDLQVGIVARRDLVIRLWELRRGA